jgi:predicted phosphodiesterase
MRYGIFSDVHSNLEALNAVIQAFQKEDMDKYLCVGDVVGYGANPKECISLVRKLAEASVAGNHDWACVDLFSVDDFNPAAKDAVLWTRNMLDETDRYFLSSLEPIYKNDTFCLVHGSLSHPEDFDYIMDAYAAAQTFSLMKNQICFIGHSHVAGVFIDSGNSISYPEVDRVDIKEKNKYIVNVGSVGQPRDGNPDSAYCIYDSDKKQIQIKRVAYDTKTARKRILDAGLPRFLGDRLLVGH